MIYTHSRPTHLLHLRLQVGAAGRTPGRQLHPPRAAWAAAAAAPTAPPQCPAAAGPPPPASSPRRAPSDDDEVVVLELVTVKDIWKMMFMYNMDATRYRHPTSGTKPTELMTIKGCSCTATLYLNDRQKAPY